MQYKAALLLFFTQMLVYFLVTLNWLMIANKQKALTFFSDLVFAAVNFLLVKKIVEAKSKLEWAAYTFGGAIGSVIAIDIVHHLIEPLFK